MKEWNRNKYELFLEDLGFIYDCYIIWEFISKEMKTIISNISASPYFYNVLSPSIINITNRIPSDSKKTAKKINELISFTIQGYNISIGHCILLNKYDNSYDIFLPTTSIVSDSKLFAYWLHKCSVLENNPDYIGDLYIPERKWRNIIMTHSGMNASSMAYFTFGS